MIATYINCILVLVGSALGLLLKNRIGARFMAAMHSAMALCVMGIGISSAVKTEHTLCVILCMVVGTCLGVALRIEQRLDALGDWIQKKVVKKSDTSKFTEGFVTAALLYCVGSMAVMGSLEAGINHDYSILVSKGVIDGVTGISLAATTGVGVAFSVIPLLLYQGGLTLLAGLVGPLLTDAIVLEMSAVGGTIILGIGFNMLFPEKHIPVGNMLPAIFLPIAYLSLAGLLGGVV